MSDKPAATVLGRLQGKVVTLDAHVPPLDGKRIAVVLRAAEHDEVLISSETSTEWWHAWVARGPQGPIEDEEEPELP